MLIEKNLAKYIIFSEESILNALKKISINGRRIIFSLTEDGVLEGIFTDGDFRRWIIAQNDMNLNQPLYLAYNKKFLFFWEDEDLSKCESYFSQGGEVIPILDHKRRLVAIVWNRSSGIFIGDFVINHNSPTFIIAEIGNNHNGSLENAKKLIDLAKEAGANVAKFQIRDLASLYHNGGNANDASEDLGSQYTLDLLSKFQLSQNEMFAAFDYCKEKNILPLCTPWDIESLSLLQNYGMPAYKVASADLTNYDLLTALARTKKPLICSTGMSKESEIIDAVRVLKSLGAEYILLHCNSTYPAPFKDINLNYLDRLKEIGECPVGYSGHERGIYVTIAAVAKGAKVIEKHFTLDKSWEGNDHRVSLLFPEFKAMVEGIRQVEEAMGKNSERSLSQGELMNREILAKSLVITRNLAPKEIITEDIISVKSPGRGLQPNRKQELIGLKAKRNFKAGDFFFDSDLIPEIIQPRQYIFSRKWGIPVRYHDFKKLSVKTNPDLLEFHLSYKDIETDIYEYFDSIYNHQLIVHSPELFAGDHILDLCSQDEAYRQQSIKNLQKVINITREITKFFPNTTRTKIVTNVGGFTSDAFLPVTKRHKLYEILLDSMTKIDQIGVEIIPQTMPPLPWHFGGQRYHNIFVDPHDIASFCHDYNYRICCDISHAKLACNYYKWSLTKYIEEVGEYTTHMHIADAKGVDGEGLQIGAGEIHFPALVEVLSKVTLQASFIPEIWQGHKNEGEGFWIALDKLEHFFEN
ncbi:acetylneuraminic acid synthetase [Nostoc sp. 'Peltigera membranacea cyanobiont' 213]|uniref:N-acetylneuraminate synthase family protein n=1 Tax=Nostoc sp. 'Peltigera membranacea cyanobiont' 213 TaxID=2014530 RepID=UPI000B95589E|nr:N-acetylneuraminate synthase family protein [Nostoc sp. 'Peltigera membranacea cyanobiont' 213]OYD94321.1 acetylneuraminic acid synthetase [Nostoc sp. 'Peltigera membranacea cyanobiont' 213]